MHWPVTGHPGLAPDISRQVPDIPALRRTSQGRCRTSQVPDIPALRRTSQGRFRTSQGRCRTSRPCTGHLKAGAGHPRSLCRTSRPCAGHLEAGAGHPRCRTSRPCAGHLKAGAGHLKTGTGHPGQALDFLMNSIKDHKSSPRSKSLTLPVANWPTECLRTKSSTLLGSHSFLLLSQVSFSSS